MGEIRRGEGGREGGKEGGCGEWETVWRDG